MSAFDQTYTIETRGIPKVQKALVIDNGDKELLSVGADGTYTYAEGYDAEKVIAALADFGKELLAVTLIGCDESKGVDEHTWAIGFIITTRTNALYGVRTACRGPMPEGTQEGDYSFL